MQTMFKTLLLAAAMVGSSVAAMAQYTGTTYAQAKASKKANWVLTYSEAPGFASNDGAGGLKGITMDIMMAFERYVEETHGIDVNMAVQVKNPDDFAQFLDLVKKSNGGVFGLSNTTITNERKATYNFSPAYITNIGMILSHSSVPTLNSMDEFPAKFAGMTAVSVKNSTNEDRILHIKKTYYPAMNIVYVPGFSSAMDMIAKDPKKFANVDFTYYFQAIQDKQPIKRHPGGDDKTEQFGIIMPKSNDWSPLLNEFMNSGFLESTEYKKIISNNLGQAAMKFFATLK